MLQKGIIHLLPQKLGKLLLSDQEFESVKRNKVLIQKYSRLDEYEQLVKEKEEKIRFQNNQIGYIMKFLKGS